MGPKEPQKMTDSTFLQRLIEALERADQQVPHSTEHDDAIDTVWGVVAEYRLAQ